MKKILFFNMVNLRAILYNIYWKNAHSAQNMVFDQGPYPLLPNMENKHTRWLSVIIADCVMVQFNIIPITTSYCYA